MIGFFESKKPGNDNRFDFFVFLLTIFTLSGFFFSEIVFMGIKSGQINNAEWFAVQALIGSWLLLSLFLLRTKTLQKTVFLSFAVVLISFPTTIQYLTVRYSDRYYTVGPHALDVITFFETVPSEAVILAPPNFREPSLATNFAGKTSVYSVFHSFVSQRLGQDEVRRRINDFTLFFKGDDQTTKTAILEKYNVSYVYAPIKYRESLEHNITLIPVLRNEEYVVYKVSRDKRIS
jgi:hypothetical protein